MQIYKSYYYLFALQQQIQAVMRNRIHYPYLEHEWIRISHATFLVRDFHTNQLLYDSTENLALGWYHQNIQHVCLVPYSTLNLENNQFSEHPYLQIITAEQPILIAQLGEIWHCLLPCLEKTINKVIASDNLEPHNKHVFMSSQYNEHLRLFTLIKLPTHHQHTIQHFISALDWQDFSLQLLEKVYSISGVLPYTRMPLQLTNNLAFEGTNRFLLKKPPKQANIGFSLWNEFVQVSTKLFDYQQIQNDQHDFSHLSDEQKIQFFKYAQDIDQQKTLLMCHLANQYQYAFVDVKTFCQLLKQHGIPVEEQLQHEDYQYRTEIEKQLDEGTYPKLYNGWKTLLHLIIFLALLLVLLSILD